ncbi:MAG: hypothetical protein OXF75_08940 [Acidimicrobiaceae bacterium]|nr:hypothetical protein [Acidimicrobiaceae bacterium]
MTLHDSPTDARSEPSEADLSRAAFTLIRAAAACAAFCEHIEHNEPATTHQVVAAAESMRRVAAELSDQSGVSLRQAYENRIRGVEATSLLRYSGTTEQVELVGADALASARRWDEVQIAQLAHDRRFHPDVFGLPKIEQLRHYSFHVTKLAGLLADAVEQGSWDAFRDERLADIAVFGVKLATVCNEHLPSTDVDLT